MTGASSGKPQQRNTTNEPGADTARKVTPTIGSVSPTSEPFLLGSAPQRHATASPPRTAYLAALVIVIRLLTIGFVIAKAVSG